MSSPVRTRRAEGAMAADSFGAQSSLDVGDARYRIWRLDALSDHGDLGRLPYSTTWWQRSSGATSSSPPTPPSTTAASAGLRSTPAVVAESFERIHRSNLAGMGVLAYVLRQLVAAAPGRKD